MMEKMKMMIISWGERTKSSGNPFEEYHLEYRRIVCVCDWLTGFGIKLVSGNLDGASYHVLHSKHHCRQCLQGWCIITILSSLRWEAAKKTLHILAVLWHFYNICLGGFWSCLEICNEMMMRMRDAPCVCCFAILSWCPAEMMMMVPKRFSSASAELSIVKHFVFVFSLESQLFSWLFRNRCSDHQSKICWPQKYSNLFYVYFVFRSARFCFLLADVDGDGCAGK